MRKIIKKWGNAAGVLFSREDLELYGLKIGDVVDLADMRKVEVYNPSVVLPKKKVKKKKAKKDLKSFLGKLPQ